MTAELSSKFQTPQRPRVFPIITATAEFPCKSAVSCPSNSNSLAGRTLPHRLVHIGPPSSESPRFCWQAVSALFQTAEAGKLRHPRRQPGSTMVKQAAGNKLPGTSRFCGVTPVNTFRKLPPSYSGSFALQIGSKASKDSLGDTGIQTFPASCCESFPLPAVTHVWQFPTSHARNESRHSTHSKPQLPPKPPLIGQACFALDSATRKASATP